MRVYRICRAAFQRLDGEGARLYGARWNSPGRAAVYTSSTLSLAAIEYLVHIDPVDIPNDVVALTIDIPDDIAVESIDESLLPAGWERISESADARALGDRWLEKAASAVLRVPSAPIPSETNVLLNPRHADFARVRTESRYCHPLIFWGMASERRPAVRRTAEDVFCAAVSARR